ncbi:unnamed protein product [Camellia sinensis]
MSENRIHIMDFGWNLDKHSTLFAASEGLLRLVIRVTTRAIRRLAIQIGERPNASRTTPRGLRVGLPRSETGAVGLLRAERRRRRRRSGARHRGGRREDGKIGGGGGAGGRGFEEGAEGGVEREVVAFEEEKGFVSGSRSDFTECVDEIGEGGN